MISQKVVERIRKNGKPSIHKTTITTTDDIREINFDKLFNTDLLLTDEIEFFKRFLLVRCLPVEYGRYDSDGRYYKADDIKMAIDADRHLYPLETYLEKFCGDISGVRLAAGGLFELSAARTFIDKNNYKGAIPHLLRASLAGKQLAVIMFENQILAGQSRTDSGRKERTNIKDERKRQAKVLFVDLKREYPSLSKESIYKKIAQKMNGDIKAGTIKKYINEKKN